HGHVRVEPVGAETDLGAHWSGELETFAQQIAGVDQHVRAQLDVGVVERSGDIVAMRRAPSNDQEEGFTPMRVMSALYRGSLCRKANSSRVGMKPASSPPSLRSMARLSHSNACAVSPRAA